MNSHIWIKFDLQAAKTLNTVLRVIIHLLKSLDISIGMNDTIIDTFIRLFI